MLPDIFALLNVASITAFVGTTPPRIYRHGVAPLSVVAPYLTWFVIDGIPENALDGTPPVDRFSVQLDLWSSNSGDGAEQINSFATAVRDQIETAHYIDDFSSDGQDATTQRYRASIIFTYWKPRP